MSRIDVSGIIHTMGQLKERKTVFIADDDPAAIEMLKLLCKLEGLATTEILAQDSPASILEKAQEADIGLLDIEMPGRIDGIKLVSIVREKLPDMPIILASCNGGYNVAAEELNCGFEKKPFEDLDHLFKMLSGACAVREPVNTIQELIHA